MAASICLPWARAMGYTVRMKCRVPLLPHRAQSGVSDRFHLFRFAGVVAHLKLI